jgi:hypothetical protein
MCSISNCAEIDMANLIPILFSPFGVIQSANIAESNMAADNHENWNLFFLGIFACALPVTVLKLV